MNDTVEINLSKLRYAVYVRKSTEAAEKQVRTLDDQERDCRKLADDLGINIVATIREKKSAKAPNSRPLFKQLLKDIKSSKYDGVLSWHPDRLARNTIDSGQIIYLLDTGVIKDLRFVSHQFSNNANGKMLLGMLFVFAKHYSDDLSHKVKRGVDGNFRDGKSSGTRKHGYIRDEDGIYRPDGDNFTLMQKAWSMRAEGTPNTEIAEYLNSNGYSRFLKKDNTHITSPIGTSILGKVFNDTFYFGILCQTNQTTDLRELVTGFIPMINEDMFYKVQTYNNHRRRGPSKKLELFMPLRHLLYCGVCDYEKSMTVSRSKGRDGKRYLYYSCKNKECTRAPRSMRAKLVFNSITDLLNATVNQLPEVTYKRYLDEMSQFTDSKKVDIRKELARKKVVVAGHQKTRNDLTSSLNKQTDERSIMNTNERMANLSVEIDSLNNSITKLEVSLKKSTMPVLSASEFWGLIRLTDKKMQKGQLFQKDRIIRNYFLKLYVDNEKVVSYHWKEPFASLMETTQISYGRGERTRTFDLTVPNRAR